MNYVVDNALDLNHVTSAFPYPDVELIESDGIPLEAYWHSLAITLLRDVLTVHFRGRDDYYCAGNMFLYYDEEESRNRNFRGPDFFFVNGVPLNKDRRWWAIWEEEGRFPDMILEMLSPSTMKIDRVEKKEIYQDTFETSEYFVYDFDEPRLEGWRLDTNTKYQPIEPNEHGWLWCEEVGLWLGAWRGEFVKVTANYPRFYTSDGELAPTGKEQEQIEKEQEKKRAEQEKKRAEQEKKRAEQEKKRADFAELELVRLKAQLDQIQKKPREERN